MTKHQKPPTLEQVIRKIDKSGLSIRQFSRINGIPSNTINHYLKHRRSLPKKFYSIFKRVKRVSQVSKTKRDIERITELRQQLNR